MHIAHCYTPKSPTKTDTTDNTSQHMTTTGVVAMVRRTGTMVFLVTTCLLALVVVVLLHFPTLGSITPSQLSYLHLQHRHDDVTTIRKKQAAATQRRTDTTQAQNNLGPADDDDNNNNDHQLTINELNNQIQQLKHELKSSRTVAPTPQGICTLLRYSQSACPIPPTPTSCLAGKKITIIGDSNAFHMFAKMHRSYLGCHMVRSGGKCHEEQTYFNFSQSRHWQPECKRCDGCVSELQLCANSTKLEHLAIETLEDHQMPSNEFNTTQENIVEYMSRDPPHLIVLNAGVHLMSYYSVNHIFNGHPYDNEHMHSYHDRLIWYFQYIKRKLPGTRLVWLATPKVKPGPWGEGYTGTGWYEKQDRLQAMTRKIAAQNLIPVFDTYAMSDGLDLLRSDDNHFFEQDNKYYQIISDMLIKWFCSNNPM